MDVFLSFALCFFFLMDFASNNEVETVLRIWKLCTALLEKMRQNCEKAFIAKML